ncbi:MAG: tyrosine-type recombinase/integrase [Peptococcaceae bacterium]|nr:tyrosine-type recombinase/integrase [Peptococcaceae bacterium]
MHHIKRLSAFYKIKFSELDPRQIREYILFLVEKENVSRAYQNQAISALRFLYEKVLKIPLIIDVHRPMPEQRLPTVLNRSEVVRIFNSISNIKHKALLMLTYSGGLRVSEVVKLKLEDIDEERKMIHIREAKGRKDRYTILSEVALVTLKKYKEIYMRLKIIFFLDKSKECKRSIKIQHFWPFKMQHLATDFQ